MRQPVLLVSGRRGREARGLSSGCVCWETVPFQNTAGPRCTLCHFSPLPEKSLKLNGSRGGIFSKCQCNLWYITAKAIILVPGSECQRTGRERATNSRLAGGTLTPLSWEITLAGEGAGPPLGSVGWDCGPLWGTHNGPERACVCCELSCFGACTPFHCHCGLEGECSDTQGRRSVSTG